MILLKNYNEYYTLGDDIWHEVTHGLEDLNGDFIKPDTSTLYDERNIAYMDAVAKSALIQLEGMEKFSKNYRGATPEVLKGYWDKYIMKMNNAVTEIKETQEYPPDINLMKDWFGFDVEPDKIINFYASGKMGQNYKDMAELVMKHNWTGTWDTTYGEVVFGQKGTRVSGMYSDTKGRIEGYADGNKLIGRWSKAPSYAGQEDSGPLIFTISDDGKSFQGKWRRNMDKFWYDWSGKRIEPKEEPEFPKEPEIPVPEKPVIIGTQTEPFSYSTEGFGIWGITGDLVTSISSDGTVTVELQNIKRKYDEAWANYNINTTITSIEPRGDSVHVNVLVKLSGLANKVQWYKWEDRKWGPASENISNFEKNYGFDFKNINNTKDFKKVDTSSHYEGPKFEKPTHQ